MHFVGCSANFGTTDQDRSVPWRGRQAKWDTLPFFSDDPIGKKSATQSMALGVHLNRPLFGGHLLARSGGEIDLLC